jgi:hypothetical protein
MINISNLLPEKISDKEAYDLVNFFMNLALELESHYFAQTKRYINDDVLDYQGERRDDTTDELPF